MEYILATAVFIGGLTVLILVIWLLGKIGNTSNLLDFTDIKIDNPSFTDNILSGLLIICILLVLAIPLFIAGMLIHEIAKNFICN